MAQTQREKDEKDFQELKTLAGEQDGRLHDLQTNAFQLANYYFVFQGVILAAISNTSSLTCSDRWFLFTLSLLAAVVNLSALCNMGVEYITTRAEYEITLCDYNRLSNTLNDPTQSSRRRQQPTNQVQNRLWSDRYKLILRYVYLGLCMALFLGFAGVTLFGSWRILCEHKDCRSRQHSDNCINVCDGMKCMKLCYDN